MGNENYGDWSSKMAEKDKIASLIELKLSPYYCSGISKNEEVKEVWYMKFFLILTVYNSPLPKINDISQSFYSVIT